VSPLGPGGRAGLELIEQRLGVDQIARVEAFGESAVEPSEQVVADIAACRAARARLQRQARPGCARAQAKLFTSFVTTTTENLKS